MSGVQESESQNRPISVFEHSQWRKSLVTLANKGGVFQKAYSDACALAFELKADVHAWRRRKLTNYGCQIDKALKLDLAGSARMVFMVDAHVVILLFAGDHKAVDTWCEQNRYKKFYVDKKNKLIELDDCPAGEQRIAPAVFPSARPLMELLPGADRQRLLQGLPGLHIREVSRLDSTCSDIEIEGILDGLVDTEKAALLLDVLLELRLNRVSNAIRKIQLATGQLQEIASTSQDDELLMPGPGLAILPRNEAFYRTLLAVLAKSSSLRDWMLLLHPDQQDVVDAEFDGPAMLCGISGSGKTCVVVRRAMELVRRYDGTRILVVTLNRSLALLIKHLVLESVPPEVAERIDVMSFFELCSGLLTEFEPSNTRQYVEVADKTNNHVDDVWREFYRYENNNRKADVLAPVHDSLISRRVDAEGYIREEFDVIRSVAPSSDRDIYLSVERTGRVYPLTEEFRSLLLKGLEYWEEKCWDVGVIDSLGMAVALQKYSDQIRARYRCALVDESQDFGTIELDIVRRLVPDADDNLFLAGDLAQRISLKSRRIADLGIDIPARRRVTLDLNYRNSREILEVASIVLLENVPEEHRRDADFLFVSPQTSDFSGPPPRLLSGDNLEQEIAFAVAYARAVLRDRSEASVCIAFAGLSEFEVTRFATDLRLPTLQGLTTVTAGSIFLSDLECTKGFEFNEMIVLNLVPDDFPSSRCPEGEEWRDACRLYVAMTRARTELTLSYHGELSHMLTTTRSHLLEGSWREYVEGDPPLFGEPKRLDQMRWDRDPASGEDVHIRDCTAAQFLFRREALGLDSALIVRLRELVTGSRRFVGKEQREWQTIGQLLLDIEVLTAARRVAGPATVEKLKVLAGMLPA